VLTRFLSISLTARLSYLLTFPQYELPLNPQYRQRSLNVTNSLFSPQMLHIGSQLSSTSPQIIIQDIFTESINFHQNVLSQAVQDSEWYF
jgi:hypothetical protein